MNNLEANKQYMVFEGKNTFAVIEVYFDDKGEFDHNLVVEGIRGVTPDEDYEAGLLAVPIAHEILKNDGHKTHHLEGGGTLYTALNFVGMKMHRMVGKCTSLSTAMRDVDDTIK